MRLGESICLILELYVLAILELNLFLQGGNTVPFAGSQSNAGKSAAESSNLASIGYGLLIVGILLQKLILFPSEVRDLLFSGREFLSILRYISPLEYLSTLLLPILLILRNGLMELLSLLPRLLCGLPLLYQHVFEDEDCGNAETDRRREHCHRVVEVHEFV